MVVRIYRVRVIRVRIIRVYSYISYTSYEYVRMNIMGEYQGRIQGGVLGVLGPPPLGVPTLERINTIYVKGLTSHGPR